MLFTKMKNGFLINSIGLLREMKATQPSNLAACRKNLKEAEENLKYWRGCMRRAEKQARQIDEALKLKLEVRKRSK